MAAKPRGQPGPKKQRLFIASHRMYARRHTFASLAVADGVPLSTVNRLMGHASIKLTADVYSKFLPKQREEAAAHLNRLFLLLRIA